MARTKQTVRWPAAHRTKRHVLDKHTSVMRYTKMIGNTALPVGTPIKQPKSVDGRAALDILSNTALHLYQHSMFFQRKGLPEVESCEVTLLDRVTTFPITLTTPTEHVWEYAACSTTVLFALGAGMASLTLGVQDADIPPESVRVHGGDVLIIRNCGERTEISVTVEREAKHLVLCRVDGLPY